ncbi:unnamed protein product [Merluccius merluccius]
MAPCRISLGRCDAVSFSICWATRGGAAESPGTEVWLNGTGLGSIGTRGRFVSLTVPQTVENRLSLQHRGDARNWTFSLSPATVKIRGVDPPVRRPSRLTQEQLDVLSGVFGCENGTLFFHQDENLILAIGYTTRHPVHLESWSSSTLLLRWEEQPGGPREPGTPPPHPRVSLYRLQLGSYSLENLESAQTHQHHRFTALEPCSSYTACLEPPAGTVTCISTLTDPGEPRFFRVSVWNSSSISVEWECPENRRFSLFLLTAFYLDGGGGGGGGGPPDEVRFWHRQRRRSFTLAEVPPCSRVRLGLQTVCQTGTTTRLSRMERIDGNSVRSSIAALQQESWGPESYTLSWEVGNTSSVSGFRVFHQGAPQGGTLLTRHTVGGLAPCGRYRARVQALCGDGVVMDTKTIAVSTGPRGVRDLRYRANDSMVLWTPGTPQHVVFSYRLARANGSEVRTGRLTRTGLHLPGLETGQPYVLDLLEECDEGAGTSDPGTSDPRTSDPRTSDPGTSDPGTSDPGTWDPRTSDPRTVCFQGAHVPMRPRGAPEAGRPGTSTTKYSVGKVLCREVLLLPKWGRRRRRRVGEESGRGHALRRPVCRGTRTRLRSSGVWRLLACSRFTCCYGNRSVTPPPPPPPPPERGVFSRCAAGRLAGGVSRDFLRSRLGGDVSLLLNDGRCKVEEHAGVYSFSTPPHPSPCGTARTVNETHIELRNTLRVTLRGEEPVARGDLLLVWACVFPRRAQRTAQLRAGLDWVGGVSLVEVNASLVLGVAMALYSDASYASSYRHPVELDPEDFLFFHVELRSNDSFAPQGVLLQLASCWASETSDPRDPVQAMLLRDGCAVDPTLQWVGANGRSSSTRFSVQMFHMPTLLPLFFHCLTHVCGPDQDCTPALSRRAGLSGEEEAVVSSGPLLVRGGTAPPTAPPALWAEGRVLVWVLVWVLGGFIGCLALALLAISAASRLRC